MANRLAPTYPILVAEWQRNGREIIRIARDRFNKRETIDIRSWRQDSEDSRRPGRGLTFSVKHLPALAEGLVNPPRSDSPRRRRLPAGTAPHHAAHDRLPELTGVAAAAGLTRAGGDANSKGRSSEDPAPERLGPVVQLVRTRRS